jgi:hypothetical protein
MFVSEVQSKELACFGCESHRAAWSQKAADQTLLEHSLSVAILAINLGLLVSPDKKEK